MVHIGRKVECLFIVRQVERLYFPFAAGQLFFVTRSHIGHINVRITGGFALEVKMGVIYPTRIARTAYTRTTYPRVIMLPVN